MTIFEFFDKLVDSKAGKMVDNLKVVEKSDNAIKTAFDYEATFVSKSSKSANATMAEVLALLKVEHEQIQKLFKREYGKATEEDFDSVTNGYTALTKMKISVMADVSELHNVCSAALEASNKIIEVEGSLRVSPENIVKLKKSQLVVLELSSELVEQLEGMFDHVNAVTRMSKNLPLKADWDNLKRQSEKILNNMETCERLILKSSVVLQNVFTLFKVCIEEDATLEKAIKTQMNILEHGSAEGKVITKSSGPYNPDDYSTRKNMQKVKEYARELEEKEHKQELQRV
jgi:hypothetical protein